MSVADGFMTSVLLPTPTRVDDTSVVRIPDEDQTACGAAVRSILGSPIPELLEFTVAVPASPPSPSIFAVPAPPPRAS